MFFYFSSIDQRHHMLYREADPTDPLRPADTAPELANSMRDTYRQIDEQVGKVMRAVGENTAIVVMSDHGFSPFRRQVHLNRWLEQHGYLRLTDSFNRDNYEWLQGIDWSATRAFAIGLNSLYLNVRGREKRGIVSPKQRAALAGSSRRSSAAGSTKRPARRSSRRSRCAKQIYHGPFVDAAPDIIVGYAAGYRASWDTTTGKVPLQLIEPNIDEWTGDHCIDSRAVPGVLLSNRPLRARVGRTRGPDRLGARLLRRAACRPA